MHKDETTPSPAAVILRTRELMSVGMDAWCEIGKHMCTWQAWRERLQEIDMKEHEAEAYQRLLEPVAHQAE